MPIIVHIDMNAFFASCEVKKNPSLKGKKVIICGKTKRSIVSAASYEAKKDGVYTTMPYFMAKERCPDGIFLNVDHSFYYQVSNEIFSYIRSKFKIVEQTSIDECFIDMSKVKIDNPNQFFRNFQKYIYETFHIPCSIGVSYNKFLAKMASDLKKPMGITFIKKADVPNIIWPLPIENMYGCGKATSKKLRELDINTIGDLIKYQEIAKPILGNNFELFIQHAQGSGSSVLNTEYQDPKSIGNSFTLPYDTNDYDLIKSEIKRLAEHVSERLQTYQMIGYTITLTIKDYEFISHNKSKKMIAPSDDYDKIYLECLKLLDKLTITKVRLVGVSVSDLIKIQDYYEQLDFYKLEQYQNTPSEIFIEKLNQIAGDKIFKKAKDVLKDQKNGYRN